MLRFFLKKLVKVGGISFLTSKKEVIFLLHVVNCLIISNWHVFIFLKGLVQVFEEKCPTFEHMYCLRHLYANFKKKFGGGTLFRDLLMDATKETKATSEEC